MILYHANHGLIANLMSAAGRAHLNKPKNQQVMKHDARGLSYYADGSIARLLSLSPQALGRARESEALFLSLHFLTLGEQRKVTRAPAP